jgi:hypothetical protein
VTGPRSLPGDVILAQVQTTVVDLFHVAGLDLDVFAARVPPGEGSGRSTGLAGAEAENSAGNPVAAETYTRRLLS